ncbi:uncharacterized protein LOC144442461 [Glandiceps talaboti]
MCPKGVIIAVVVCLVHCVDVNEGTICQSWDCTVNKEFIRELEGFSKDGYVPTYPNGTVLGHSGVTIGNGIDLGSKNAEYFQNIGVSEEIIRKLQHYFGLQKDAAVQKLNEIPLSLTDAEAADLSNRVMDSEFCDVAESYDEAVTAIGNSNLKEFRALSIVQRTVTSSVYFQYGRPSRFPTFWGHVTNQRWTHAVAELRNFGDAYSTRRNKEAQLLEDDDGSTSTCSSTAAPPTTPSRLSPTDCRDYGDDGRFCVDTFDEFPQENIVVNFRLFTRSYQNGVDMQFSSALHAGFQPGRPIKFITHGFQSKGSTPWVLKIADQLLDVGDFNVIVVDWEDAADPSPPWYKVGKFIEYDGASSNTRIVASRVVRLLGFMLNQHGSSAINDVHLIGHSLGAQISGMVGKWARKLNCDGSPCRITRVTALDPARPNFLVSSGDKRRVPGPFCVSRDDADFVDVIHTDANENDDHTGGTFPQLGIYQALGHADYYPNGGNQQPGCTLFPCDHSRATLLFAASINSRCSFIAEKCTSRLALKSESCNDCLSPPCPMMGYHAVKPSLPTLYLLQTTGDEPFCGHSVGCFKDRSSSPALPHQATSLSKITIDACNFYCRGRGYPYSGLQYTSNRQSCWCGETYNKYGQADDASECSHRCSDAPKGHYCGGNRRNSVYRSGYVGCIRESDSSVVNDRITSDTMYVQQCYVYCSYHGYEYAGLSDSKTCACGNGQSESNTVAPSECSYNCGGYANEQCGGPGRVSIFRTGIDSICLEKGQNGDCDFFECFNHRHVCNEGRRYDLSKGLTHYCQMKDKIHPRYISAWTNAMQCVTRAILKKYKELPVTYSDSTCKDLYNYGRKLFQTCYKKSTFSESSSLLSSSEEMNFYDTLKSDDAMNAFKIGVEQMVEDTDSAREDSVLYLLETQVEDISRQFYLANYHDQDAAINEMNEKIRSQIFDLFPPKSPVIGIDSSCEELARSASCDFYKCFEKRYPCGSDGFALSYIEVCEGENRIKHYLKSNGASRMDSVQSCVMSALLLEYQADENSCRRIEYTIRDAYRSCYKQHMNCGFVAENQYQLTDAYTVPFPNKLQFMAQGLITDTLCDAYGTPLYLEKDGHKFRAVYT